MPAELQAVAAAQGVEIRTGDVVLVRTGNDLVWNEPARLSAWAAVWMAVRRNGWPGLGIKATGADPMAWDAIGLWDPELNMELPGHATFLVEYGIYIIEESVFGGAVRRRRLDVYLRLHAVEIRGRDREDGQPDRDCLTRQWAIGKRH